VTMRSTGSGWREIDVAEALRRARAVAPSVGVTRVTEVTRLDRLGVPVAIGVRPGAMAGSTCVTAGKGLTLDDAYVGATMEAIEAAFAEPSGLSPVEIVVATPSDVLDGRTRRGAIVDFCPKLGVTIDLGARYPCVRAEDLASGTSVLVPAESVFIPFAFPGTFLGSSSNGLASGSSINEATLHALCEVIERDAYSIALLEKPPLIDRATLPEPLAGLDRRIRARGFATWYFSLPNPFGVPCVAASLYDLDDRRFMTSGQGCHLSPEVAGVRALTEAIQSRATIIHGGRDDLAEVLDNKRVLSWERMEAVYQHAKRLIEKDPPLPFSALPDLSPHAPSIGAAIALLGRRLREAGFPWLLRVVLTPPDHPVTVVRVLVPRFERYGHHNSTSIGPRLRAFKATLKRRRG
jgi:ribosomal protein S12 methylthiotransferase accessory factor